MMKFLNLIIFISLFVLASCEEERPYLSYHSTIKIVGEIDLESDEDTQGELCANVSFKTKQINKDQSTKIRSKVQRVCGHIKIEQNKFETDFRFKSLGPQKTESVSEKRVKRKKGPAFKKYVRTSYRVDEYQINNVKNIEFTVKEGLLNEYLKMDKLNVYKGEIINFIVNDKDNAIAELKLSFIKEKDTRRIYSDIQKACGQLKYQANIFFCVSNAIPEIFAQECSNKDFNTEKLEKACLIQTKNCLESAEKDKECLQMYTF